MKERRLIYMGADVPSPSPEPADSPEKADTTISFEGLPAPEKLNAENIDSALAEAEKESAQLDGYIESLSAQYTELGGSGEVSAREQNFGVKDGETKIYTLKTGEQIDTKEEIQEELSIAKGIQEDVNRIIGDIKEVQVSDKIVMAQMKEEGLELSKVEGSDNKYTFSYPTKKDYQEDVEMRVEKGDGSGLSVFYKINAGGEFPVPKQIKSFKELAIKTKELIDSRSPEKIHAQLGAGGLEGVGMERDYLDKITFKYEGKAGTGKVVEKYPTLKIELKIDDNNIIVEGSDIAGQLRGQLQALQTDKEMSGEGTELKSGIEIKGGRVKFTVAGVERSFIGGRKFIGGLKSKKEIQKKCYIHLLSIVFRDGEKARRIGNVGKTRDEFEASNKEMVRRLVQELGVSKDDLQKSVKHIPDEYYPPAQEAVKVETEAPKAAEKKSEPEKKEAPERQPEAPKPKYEYHVSHEAAESLSTELPTDIELTLPPKYNLEADLINHVWKMLNRELTDGVKDLMADIRESGGKGPHMDKSFYAISASRKMKELGLFKWAKAKIGVLKSWGDTPTEGSIKLTLDSQEKKALTDIFLNLHGIGVEKSKVVEEQKAAREESRDKRVEGDLAKIVKGDHKLDAITGELSDSEVKTLAVGRLSKAIFNKLSTDYSGVDEAKVIEAFESISKGIIGTQEVNDLKSGAEIEIDEAKSAEYAAAFFKVGKEAVLAADQKQIEAAETVDKVKTIDLNSDKEKLESWRDLSDQKSDTAERFAALKKVVTEDGVSKVKIGTAEIYIKKEGNNYSFIQNPIESDGKIEGAGPKITADSGSLDSFVGFAEKERQITDAVGKVGGGEIDISSISGKERSVDSVGDFIAKDIMGKIGESAIIVFPAVKSTIKGVLGQYTKDALKSKNKIDLSSDEIRKIVTAILFPKDVAAEPEPEAKPEPRTPNPEPRTPNPEPRTPNPEPEPEPEPLKDNPPVEEHETTETASEEIQFHESYTDADRKLAMTIIKDEEAAIKYTEQELVKLRKHKGSEHYNEFVSEVKAKIQEKRKWITDFKGSLTRKKGEYKITRTGEARPEEVGKLEAKSIIGLAKGRTRFRMNPHDGLEDIMEELDSI